MNDSELITVYDGVLKKLDRNKESFSITWAAVSRRRDEIVKSKSLYRKKIKLTTQWYKPYEK